MGGAVIQRTGQFSPAEQVAGDNLTNIPVYEIAGAGPEFDFGSLEPIFQLPVLKNYLQPGIFAVQIGGDSMEPIIRKGAYVGVIPFDGEMVEGGIYLVRRPPFGLLVKRVYMDANGGIVLRSEKKDVEDQPLPYEGFDQIVVGRVVWVWQGV